MNEFVAAERVPVSPSNPIGSVRSMRTRINGKWEEWTLVSLKNGLYFNVLGQKNRVIEVLKARITRAAVATNETPPVSPETSPSENDEDSTGVSRQPRQPDIESA